MAEPMDVMAEIFGASRRPQGKRAAKRRHPVDPLAQRMELEDRFKRGIAVPDTPLKPGDICREKTGCGVFDHEPVLVLWRWLDMDDRQDQWVARDYIKTHITSRVDCLIGFLSDDAVSICVMPAESWRLEKA